MLITFVPLPRLFRPATSPFFLSYCVSKRDRTVMARTSCRALLLGCMVEFERYHYYWLSPLGLDPSARIVPPVLETQRTERRVSVTHCLLFHCPRSRPIYF